jgi:spore maturation protein CgeB
MLRLARGGIRIAVWGGEWEKFGESHANLRIRREALDGLDYAKAINGARINLAFLRKAARDLQTTRSVEIPACGAFMLAERTDEHRRLFEEGREAEFFSSFEELERKCRYYLEHEDERARIALAGLERCRRGGYSNRERLREVLAYVARSFPALGQERA